MRNLTPVFAHESVDTTEHMSLDLISKSTLL